MDGIGWELDIKGIVYTCCEYVCQFVGNVRDVADSKLNEKWAYAYRERKREREHITRLYSLW